MKKIISLIAVALAMTMSINAAETFINGVKYSVSFLGAFASMKPILYGTSSMEKPIDEKLRGVSNILTIFEFSIPKI